jgi:hypothetical protein
LHALFAHEPYGLNILVNVSLQIFLNITGCNRETVSVGEYYCYKLQMRPNEFNIMFYGGRLFQQWLMDMYVKVESMRLDWYSLPKHQKIIRVELYRGIVDTLKAGEARASEVGRLVVLPRNFNGGECDVQARILDAMTLVQQFEKPHYFVTMMCNPYWDEVDRELFPSQTPQDRPELVVRVYRSKLHNIHDRLIKKKHFGVVWTYAHVTESQKRGLPHEHFLLVMANRDKLRSLDEFDKIFLWRSLIRINTQCYMILYASI